MPNTDIAIQLCEQYSLENRHFEKAQLKEANLEKAYLYEINLSDSNLQYANLRESSLVKANLSRANFTGANLSGANLCRANLTDANFCSGDLSRANLTGANLYRAKFSHANLSQASFLITKLGDENNISKNINSSEISQSVTVDFRFANLTGASFIGVNLNSANVEGAIYDDNTIFSPSFDPISARMIHIRMMQTFAIEELLSQFNNLFSKSKRYLGTSITTKYFNASRPEFSWLNQFQINKKNKISYVGTVSSLISHEQLYYFQRWIDSFTESYSKIIKTDPCESDNELFSLDQFDL